MRLQLNSGSWTGAVPATADAIPSIFILDASPGVTGAFMAARHEARALKARARCIIAIPDDAIFNEEDFEEFDDVVRLPIRRLRRKPVAAVLYLPRLFRSAALLARALKERGCARLQVNDFYLLEGVLAKLFGYRGQIVTWVRIDPIRYGRLISGLYLALAKRYSSAVVAVSKFIASRLQPGIRAEVIYDAAPDLPLVSPKQSRRFVFISNYVPGKGQDTAIRAFARVVETYPDAEIEFYGGDLGLKSNQQYRNRLKELSGQLSVQDRVRFGPFVSRTSTVLDGAVAALVLSRSESFSFTCLEASASGLPVIATRCGGPEEIIKSGRTGWLIPVNDERAAAAAMIEVLRAPKIAFSMGRAGAEFVREQFGRQTLHDALVRLFDLYPIHPSN